MGDSASVMPLLSFCLGSRAYPRVVETDVIIVGAGPTGLMLAAELRLAGLRPLILERQPRPRETPKASGFNGQIVELLRYRGLLDRIEAASGRPVGAARGAPFGGMELDFSHLTDPARARGDGGQPG
jgi:2-polyprenyl-6-methoxyphenol hydroxylase-like FAD-dependent oxidoreductase